MAIRRLNRDTFREIAAFATVGSIGFAVDALCTMILYHSLDWRLAYARVSGFAIAVSVTWVLNRHLTFRDARATDRVNQWSAYVLVNLGGASINLSIFFCLMSRLPHIEPFPFLSLATASIAAMTFNYLGAKYFAFPADARPKDSAR